MRYIFFISLFLSVTTTTAATLSSGVNATITPTENSSIMLYMPRVVGNESGKKMVKANSTQWLYFQIKTGNHFKVNPDAHVAVIVSGNPVQNSSSNYNEGRGITIGNAGGCVGVMMEVFNDGPDLYPNTCLPLPLHKNKTYGVSIHATSRWLAYTVYNASGAVIGSHSKQLHARNTLYSSRRDILIFEVEQKVPSPIIFTNISDGFF